MKLMILLTSMTALVWSSEVLAQKPGWVDDPGSYATDHFVAVGVAKDKKADKAREKAEKKARNGIESMIRKKYPKKDVKAAMAHVLMESYWLDPATGYQYALALLPMENIDKDYSARKKADKARNSAMGAIQMLNATTRDPDVVVVEVDEGEESSMNSETETGAGKTQIRSTDFKNRSLGQFEWVDQDGNSKYSFLGENLTVSVAGYESFKPEDGDKKTPRLEADNVSGDFTLEAKVKMDWEKYYAAGVGLYALSERQNVLTFVKYNGSYVYQVGFANDIDLPKTEKGITPLAGYAYFKLVRNGYTFSAYYSTVEGDWIEIGNVETEFPISCQIGVFFFNEEESTVPIKCDYVTAN